MTRKPTLPQGYTPPEEYGGIRPFLMTCRGLAIGIRHQRQMPQPSRCDEVTQEVLLHRRPLAIDQLYVLMMCGGG